MADLATTFDSDAKSYDKFRPGYPDSIRDRILLQTALSQGARILEIGSGTGQATGFFQELNPNQTCIDPGRNLLSRCEQNFPDYEYQCCRFEEYLGDPKTFDLIYAATSFHWIRRDFRYAHSASLLKPQGHLAVLTDRHTKHLGGFFTEVNSIYKALAPDMIATFDEMAKDDEINPLTLIDEFEIDRELTYSAQAYIGLLKTFSGHIALGEHRLNRLCEEIHSLIDKEYGGKISKTLTTYTQIYRCT